ncbi:hypothetical protein GW17_00034360 [Ensete ventricosum]|nr:hypothetical protein GW17_00034360 [Ensete ventricosum]
MLVRQVTGTRITRYRAVPLNIDRRRSISAVDGRLKKKSTVGGGAVPLEETKKRAGEEDEREGAVFAMTLRL